MRMSQRVMGRRMALFLAYWVFFALGVAESSLPPALPTLSDRMSVPLSNLGILFTARAMGFPDSYTWPKSTRREQITGLGNAVCPPVARAIVEQLAA